MEKQGTRKGWGGKIKKNQGKRNLRTIKKADKHKQQKNHKLFEREGSNPKRKKRGGEKDGQKRNVGVEGGRGTCRKIQGI